MTHDGSEHASSATHARRFVRIYQFALKYQTHPCAPGVFSPGPEGCAKSRVTNRPVRVTVLGGVQTLVLELDLGRPTAVEQRLTDSLMISDQ